MNEIIKTIIGTSKGWLFRQTLKWGSSAGAAVSTAIITNAAKANIDPSQVTEIALNASQLTAGATGLAVSFGIAVIEGVLSKKASKIAAK